MSKIAWLSGDIPRIDDVMVPLRRAKHEVLGIQTLEEARENIQNIREVDVIVTDVVIGELSLLDFMQEMKANNPKIPPIVIFSDFPQTAEVKKQAKELNVRGFVRMPVRPSVLKEQVEEILASG